MTNGVREGQTDRLDIKSWIDVDVIDLFDSLLTLKGWPLYEVWWLPSSLLIMVLILDGNSQRGA